MAKKGYQYEQVEYLNSEHCHFELSEKDRSFVPMHWHDALEVISLLDGELSVTRSGKTVSLHAGDTIVINANVPHSTVSVNGNTAILFQIPMKDLCHFVPDLREKQFVWNPFAEKESIRHHMETIRSLLNRMLDTATENPPGAALRFESLTLELLFQLYTNFVDNTAKTDYHRSEKNMERLSQILAYTEAHFREQIALKDVAGALHLQVNYFCRFFKENTGMTYLNYLNDFRLSRIYRELITTDKPIGLICEENGFTNQKLIRKLFMERFGKTPGAVRKERL